MMLKGEIRKEILKKRNSLTESEVNEKSMCIAKKLYSLDSFINSQTVFTYVDFKNEVRTIPMIEKLLNIGKRVIIPYTDVENTVIIPTEIKNMTEDLTLSAFGFLEPKKEKVKAVSPEEFDIIIVPGVAFDVNLNRIGFGKGYYDRILLHKKSNAMAVALAYEFQIKESIPAEEHDIKMDMIITELNMY